jgi:putative ABC transport system permease protein
MKDTTMPESNLNPPPDLRNTDSNDAQAPRTGWAALLLPQMLLRQVAGFVLFHEMGRRTFGMAVRSLWLHKMRSILSVLGIIIGTSAMISLMSFGEGSMKDALDDIARQGATNIIVRSVKPQDKSSDQSSVWFPTYGLTTSDLERFKTIDTVVKHVPMRIFPQKISRLDRSVQGRVVGTTGDYQSINRFKLAAGRFLIERDAVTLSNFAVIGSEVAETLFPLENPIGKTVTLKKQDYVVVGVIASRAPMGTSGSAANSEEFNRDIYIAYTTALSRHGEKIMQFQAGSRSGEIVDFHQITLTVRKMDEVKKTSKVVESMLKNHHSKQDWSVTIPLDRLEEAERAKDRYTLLLALIAGISLVVGGIGIMNIMLATVTERIREIGIRRALGAKRRDIALQFIVEAVVQTGVGGMLGVLLGLTIVFGMPLILSLLGIPLPAVLHVPSIFISLGVSIVVGVGFGWYPAHRASRLDPIEALRHV